MRSHSRCDRRGDVNAKTGERKLEDEGRIYICEGHENEDLVEDLDLDRLQETPGYLYAGSVDFSSKQKQGGIGFAGVCCFELLGFGVFEFLLIGAS